MSQGPDEGPNNAEESNFSLSEKLGSFLASLIAIGTAVVLFAKKAPPMVCVGISIPVLVVAAAILSNFITRTGRRAPKSRPFWLGVAASAALASLCVLLTGFWRINSATAGPVPDPSLPSSLPVAIRSISPSIPKPSGLPSQHTSGGPQNPGSLPSVTSDKTHSTKPEPIRSSNSPAPPPSWRKITLSGGVALDIDGGGIDAYLTSGSDSEAKLNAPTGTDATAFRPVYAEDSGVEAAACRQHPKDKPKPQANEIDATQLTPGSKICLLTSKNNWAFMQVESFSPTFRAKLIVQVEMIA
jgi:hypothetical protein